MPAAESPPRVFLDANVLFSVAYLPDGRSRVWFGLAADGRCRLLTSLHAVVEARRNLEQKHPDRAGALDELLRQVLVGSVADKEAVHHAEGMGLTSEDAVILAGAAAAGADWLVTGDKELRSFSDAAARLFGVRILSQQEALARLA